MEGNTDNFNEPVTPFKAVKESSKVSQISSSKIQADPVSGLFASPTFVSKVADRANVEAASAVDAPATISDKTAEDAATLAQLQFATPSPFPLRSKRARSTASTASDAQLASSHRTQDQRKTNATEPRRPEGFSPIACFPSLGPESAPNTSNTAAPKAQRDLFANVESSQAIHYPIATARPAAEDQTPRPKKVAMFGELVAEGLRQQLQQAPRADAISSDEDEDTEEHVELEVEAHTRLALSAKDEQWLGTLVAHYTSKAS